MPVTHIAGPSITINGRYLRQRCAWCTATLVEYDLAAVAVPAGTDPTPPTWPAGELITVDGPASWVTEPERPHGLPDDACAANPLTLASFDA